MLGEDITMTVKVYLVSYSDKSYVRSTSYDYTIVHASSVKEATHFLKMQLGEDIHVKQAQILKRVA